MAESETGYFSFAPVSSCNLRCQYCFAESGEVVKGTKMFSQALITDICEFMITEFLPNAKNFRFDFVGGGEPLLHPDFEKIVTHFSKKATLELNTNGILIHEIKDEILQRFSAMSISLYGLSEEEYVKNTNSSHSFERLLSSGAKLKRLGIRFNASIIVTKAKMNQLEDYTKLAIKLGASTLQFGTANSIGRGMDLLENDATWFLNQEDRREVYKTLRYLQNKYKNKIHILEWVRDQYEQNCTFGLSHIYINKSLSCGSGTVQWAVNEKMQFRPCVICPEIDSINFNFEDWKDYVLGRRSKNWENIAGHLENHCHALNIPVSEYCNRFEELLTRL